MSCARQLLLMAVAFGCAACIGPEPRPPEAVIYTADPPSADEATCAWYGDARGETLYFGQSAFWSGHRKSGGRPTAVLDRSGPALIGRFDLVGERLLPPLDVTRPGDRSGVWDVLLHPNGRIYFTTYFGSAGFVEPASGQSTRFHDAGTGLNELALGPDGVVLASRYGAGDTDHSGGGVAVLGPDGELLAEYPLSPPPGFVAAPKTVAWDRQRQEIWVTTDLLPAAGGPPAAIRHDAYVLDRRGAERRRIESPEIQFVAFADNGTGFLAEVEDRGLWLRILPPPPEDERSARPRILLDRDFAADLDFVQDIQVTSDGRAVVTRWSGWVHLVDGKGGARSTRLPPVEPRGIYYTAALRGRRVCATYCGGVSVVCRELSSGP